MDSTIGGVMGRSYGRHEPSYQLSGASYQPNNAAYESTGLARAALQERKAAVILQ